MESQVKHGEMEPGELDAWKELQLYPEDAYEALKNIGTVGESEGSLISLQTQLEYYRGYLDGMEVCKQDTEEWKTEYTRVEELHRDL